VGQCKKPHRLPWSQERSPHSERFEILQPPRPVPHSRQKSATGCEAVCPRRQCERLPGRASKQELHQSSLQKYLESDGAAYARELAPTQSHVKPKTAQITPNRAK